MVSNLHILVAVNLEDVTPLLVNGEPPDHVAPVKLPSADDLLQTTMLSPRAACTRRAWATMRCWHQSASRPVIPADVAFVEDTL